MTALDAFTAWAYTQGWASSTIGTRLDHLRRDGRRLGGDPWAVTPAQLVEWFAGQPWKQETKRGHRTSLRCFYAWGVEAGLVEVSPAAALPKVKATIATGRPLGEADYVNALAAAGVRERLMLRLAGEYGLRRAEVAQVWPEVDLVEDLTGWTLLVRGKGGKQRELPLSDLMAAELRSLPAGPAFPGECSGHLSPRWVGTLVSRLLPEGWTMHSLRHRFANRTYEVERDLVVVQELLGHASIVTTRGYLRTPNDRLRATVMAAAGIGAVQRVA